MNLFVEVVSLHVQTTRIQLIVLVLYLAGKVENLSPIFHKIHIGVNFFFERFLTLISDRLLNEGLTFIEALKQNSDGMNARGYWDNGAFIEA